MAATWRPVRVPTLALLTWPQDAVVGGLAGGEEARKGDARVRPSWLGCRCASWCHRGGDTGPVRYVGVRAGLRYRRLSWGPRVAAFPRPTSTPTHPNPSGVMMKIR